MKTAALLLVLVACTTALRAQQRPLVTERVDPVRTGSALFDAGFEHYREVQFRVTGLRGNLSRVGVLSLRMGLAETVEVQLSGTLQDFLRIEERFPAPGADRLRFGGDRTNDFGDLTITTKIRLKKQSGKWPGLAKSFGVQLPNASQSRGLGNDETNFFSSLLAEKRLGRVDAVVNVGLAILGDPIDAGAQDDLLTYGLAFLCPINSGFQLVGEVSGRAGAGGLGTEEQTRLRVGAQIRTGAFTWDAGLFKGLRQTDPSFGFLVGISHHIPLPRLGH